MSALGRSRGVAAFLPFSLSSSPASAPGSGAFHGEQDGRGGPSWTEREGEGTGRVCVLQSQQPPPPSQHLPKPKGDAALKMRASVRMTRYLESWGAARPFAHLNHRESVSSGETPVPSGRRPKVGSCFPDCSVLASCV